MGYSTVSKKPHWRGKKHTEETKLKMREASAKRWAKSEERLKASESHIGQISPMRGKTHTKEARQKN